MRFRTFYILENEKWVKDTKKFLSDMLNKNISSEDKKFVQGLIKHLDKEGFLSNEQKEALGKIKFKSGEKKEDSSKDDKKKEDKEPSPKKKKSGKGLLGKLAGAVKKGASATGAAGKEIGSAAASKAGDIATSVDPALAGTAKGASEIVKTAAQKAAEKIKQK